MTEVRPKALIVEDDSLTLDEVQSLLFSQGFDVDQASDGVSAINHLNSIQYDLIILDWNLPDISGIDVLKLYRANGGSGQVIMLTGHGSLDAKEVGFTSGADDYLVKPFEKRELLLRVNAVLRRNRSARKTEVEWRGISVDITTGKAAKDDEPLKLSPTEMKLLTYFLKFPEQIHAASSLIVNVWGSDAEVLEDSVRTCVKTLRKKLQVGHSSVTIKTVHGFGYILSAGD